MRILLIEDDTVLGAAVRDQIAADGQSVDWVTRLDAAGDTLRATSYDLILLDLMLPDGRGIGLSPRAHARARVGRNGIICPICLTRLGPVAFNHG